MVKYTAHNRRVIGSNPIELIFNVSFEKVAEWSKAMDCKFIDN